MHRGGPRRRHDGPAARAARAARERGAGAGTPRWPWDAEPLTGEEVDGVRVDSCAVHGTWFDGGEVRLIANAQTHARPAAKPSGWGPSGGGASSGDRASWWDVLDAITDLVRDKP